MQLTFEGKTIDQLAIELIQAYEPPEGYYLGFSGGKDSVVIYDLTKRAGVKFTAHYSVSPIDPPQIHKFIKEQYPEVVWEYNAKNFWNVHVMRHGLPTRISRWCCAIIKEGGGKGQVKILGMRRAESLKRSKYKCFENDWVKTKKKKGLLKTVLTKIRMIKPKPEQKVGSRLLPILNWSNSDVWQYISERNLEVCSLYSEGFSRIGCVLCPFAGKDEIKLSYEKFPKIVNLWKLAANKYIEKRKVNGWIPQEGGYTNGEEYFNWWIKR